MEEWEPNILVIACNWCTYQAADMAGSLRYCYPPSVKVVRVPCSGRIEPEFVIEALLNGAIAGSKGLKFAEVMKEFDETVRKLGPNTLKKV